MSESTGSAESRSPALPIVPEGAVAIDVVEVKHGAFGVSGSGDTSGFGGLVDPRVMPGPSLPPYGGWFDEFAEELTAKIEALVDKLVAGA